MPEDECQEQRNGYDAIDRYSIDRIKGPSCHIVKVMILRESVIGRVRPARIMLLVDLYQSIVAAIILTMPI